MNVSQCFIKLLYTDSSRPIPPLHRSQHENYENTFWILSTEWPHQKHAGNYVLDSVVCLQDALVFVSTLSIKIAEGKLFVRHSGPWLITGKPRHLLQSFFFVFVVYSHHKHPKYLGRKIKLWTMPFISIFSWTLTCLSHNKYFFLTTVLILIIATVSRHWEFLRMKIEARCAAFIVRHFQFQISDCQVQEE